MKEKAPNQQNGGGMTEVEDPQEVEEEVEEEEETAHQMVHRAEETHSLLDLTYHLTCDPFPAPMMRSQWENSPTSSTEIGPKQRHSLTNLTTTSYLTSTSQGS